MTPSSLETEEGTSGSGRHIVGRCHSICERMQYEFVSPIKVKTTRKGKDILLTVGIICFVIAFILELSIGNKCAFAFVVPLLYLLRLRGQLSEKRWVKDTKVELSIFEDRVEFVLFSVETTRKGSFSKGYLIPKSDIKDYCTDIQNGNISIRFDGRMEWLDESGQRIGSGNAVYDQILELMVPRDVCSALHQALRR